MCVCHFIYLRKNFWPHHTTCTLGSESEESWPLDHQEIPMCTCHFKQLCDVGMVLPFWRGKKTEMRGEVTCPRSLSKWRGRTQTPSAWICLAFLLLHYEWHTHAHTLPHTDTHITLTHTHTHSLCLTQTHTQTHRFMTAFSKWLVWNFFTKHQMLKESSLSPIGPFLKSWLWKWRKRSRSAKSMD